MGRRQLHLVGPGGVPAARKPAPRAWGPLAEPVLPDETAARIRAQSLLSGTTFADGTSSCPPLTLTQARDVLAWFGSRLPVAVSPEPPSRLRRWAGALFPWRT